MTRAEYISKYKYYAMLTHLLYGVKASITLAQGILESGNGNSALAVQGKNHFGIKGKGQMFSTYLGSMEFKTYNSVLGSYIDHAKLLHKPRYAGLFALKTADEWADELLRAGYTVASIEPEYANQLKSIIRANNLEKYDWPGNHRFLLLFLFSIILLAIIYSLYTYFQNK